MNLLRYGIFHVGEFNMAFVNGAYERHQFAVTMELNSVF
jgi:hypothetical protein